MVEGLRAHRKAQNERLLLCGAWWHNLGLVIDRGDGERCDPRSVSRRFTAAAKAAGLNLTFHGLRHAFATLMLESGVDLKVTQGLLGHSSYGITADLYTHVAGKLDRQATDLLDALLLPR